MKNVKNLIQPVQAWMDFETTFGVTLTHELVESTKTVMVQVMMKGSGRTSDSYDIFLSFLDYEHLKRIFRHVHQQRLSLRTKLVTCVSPEQFVKLAWEHVWLDNFRSLCDYYEGYYLVDSPLSRAKMLELGAISHAATEQQIATALIFRESVQEFPNFRRAMNKEFKEFLKISGLKKEDVF